MPKKPKCETPTPEEILAAEEAKTRARALVRLNLQWVKKPEKVVVTSESS